MIIERGFVSEVDGDEIVVICRSRMDCQRCAEGKGCGGGILARWLGDRQFQVHAYYDSLAQSPKQGDLVQIGLPANRLVYLAAIMYALPLLLVVISLLVLVAIFPQANDFISLIVSALGLISGFMLSSKLIVKLNKQGQLLPQLQNDLSDIPNCQAAQKNL